MLAYVWEGGGCVLNLENGITSHLSCPKALLLPRKQLKIPFATAHFKLGFK